MTTERKTYKILEVSGKQVRVQMSTMSIWMDKTMLVQMGVPAGQIKAGAEVVGR